MFFNFINAATYKQPYATNYTAPNMQAHMLWTHSMNYVRILDVI